MLSQLEEIVFPRLRHDGWQGDYPHFFRLRENRKELLSFLIHKYGGALTVEVSVVFPGVGKHLENIIHPNRAEDPKINVFATSSRFRLRGQFDGWFYYAPVYERTIRFLPFVKRKEFSTTPFPDDPRNGKGRGRLVQPGGDEICRQVATNLLQQLDDAYRWLNRRDTPQKMFSRRRRKY